MGSKLPGYSQRRGQNKQRSSSGFPLTDWQHPERVKTKRHGDGDLHHDAAKQKVRGLDDNSGGRSREAGNKLVRAAFPVCRIEEPSDRRSVEVSRWEPEADKSIDFNVDASGGGEEGYPRLFPRERAAVKLGRTGRLREKINKIDRVIVIGGTSDGYMAVGDIIVDLPTITDHDNSKAGNVGSTAVSVQDSEDDCAKIEAFNPMTDDKFTFSIPEDENEADLDDTKNRAHTNFLSSQNIVQSFESIPDQLHDAREAATPSEYGLNPKQRLNIADILPTTGFSSHKSLLKSLDEHLSTSSGKSDSVQQKLYLPLTKRQNDRLDRVVAYNRSKETLGQWIETVQRNRRTDRLPFPLKYLRGFGTKNVKKLPLITDSKRGTDFETAVHDILIETGVASIKAQRVAENFSTFEDSSEIPREKVQARQAELRKARELNFWEGIRAKRKKKIKSKTYHRVHRKEQIKVSKRNNALRILVGAKGAESDRRSLDSRATKGTIWDRHGNRVKSVKTVGRAVCTEDIHSGDTGKVEYDGELWRRIEGDGFQDVDKSPCSMSASSDTDGHWSSNQETHRTSVNENIQTSFFNGSDQNGIKSSKYTPWLMRIMPMAEAAPEKPHEKCEQRLRHSLTRAMFPDVGGLTSTLGRRKYGQQLHNSRKVGESIDFEKKLADAISSGHVADDNVIDTEGTRMRMFSPESGNARDNVGRNTHGGTDFTAPDPINQEPVKPNSQELTSSELDQTPLVVNAVARTTCIVKTPVDTESPGIDSIGKIFSGVSSPIVETKLLSNYSNQDLIRRAFVGDDVFLDFEADVGGMTQWDDDQQFEAGLLGWGSWTGEGLSRHVIAQNYRFGRKAQKMGVTPQSRVDVKRERLLVNKMGAMESDKYLAKQLPHSFESRQQYENSFKLPVGPEWTTKTMFQKVTIPTTLVGKAAVMTPMKNSIV